MAQAQSASLRQLIREHAHEIACAYDDLCAAGDDSVVLLVDRADSLGAQICEHYGLDDELNVFCVSRTELLAWFDSAELEPLSRQLLAASALERAGGGTPVISVLAVALGAALVELVRL